MQDGHGRHLCVRQAGHRLLELPEIGRRAALLADFGARVHWGKLHFLTPERLHKNYPRADDFIALRRELDPEGVFLNDHLRPLFA